MAGKFDVLWFTIPSLYGHIPPRQDMAERRGGLGTFWAHPARVTAKNLTGLAGLEPTTYGLGNRRSIRLSYSPIPALWNAKAGEVIAISASATSQEVAEAPG